MPQGRWNATFGTSQSPFRFLHAMLDVATGVLAKGKCRLAILSRRRHRCPRGLEKRLLRWKHRRFMALSSWNEETTEPSEIERRNERNQGAYEVEQPEWSALDCQHRPDSKTRITLVLLVLSNSPVQPLPPTAHWSASCTGPWCSDSHGQGSGPGPPDHCHCQPGTDGPSCA